MADSYRSVPLKSGAGAVTLTVSMDPFALSAEDRTFIFDLIDKLREYEEESSS